MDSFQPHDFILVEMEDNVSTIKRLDVSRYSQWPEDHTISELWEKKVLEGHDQE